MWTTNSNWKEKGLVKDGIPGGVLVCLFKQSEDNPKKMAHIGFYLDGETVECSHNVEYHSSRSSKWTHWAIPACIGGEVPAYHQTIRKGSTGPAVVECQDDLIQLGYDVGPTGADGKFGAKTEAAVKAFQGAHGLKQDGVVGPATWAALDEAADIPEPEPSPSIFTVTIPNLTESEADAICKQYAGAVKTAERG
jgi:hypothetical protein